MRVDYIKDISTLCKISLLFHVFQIIHNPPFNTAKTFDSYEDNLEHSIWLTMMRDRLIHLKRLLRNDGSIWVHLDDSELHRMRLLLDEVFGPDHYIAELVWQKADVFENIIPLTTGSMTKVGPGTDGASGEVSGQVGGQVSGQASGQAVMVKLDGQRLMDLLDFCSEPRTRTEMQEFSGISSRDYFRNNILNPLLETGRIIRMIPEKPNSPNQKYRKA